MTVTMRICEALVRRRAEVAKYGGIRLTDRELSRMMVEDGRLSAPHGPGPLAAERVRAALSDGGRSDVGGHGEIVPPFLERVDPKDPEIVNVSAEHPGVRAWIDGAVAAYRRGAAPEKITVERLYAHGRGRGGRGKSKR